MRGWGKWALAGGVVLFVGVVLWVHYFGRIGWNGSDEAGGFTTGVSEGSIGQTRPAAEEEIAALEREELELAEAVAKDFPDSAGALELMGNFHSRHGRRAEAAEYWQKCLEKDPRRFSVYVSLGTVGIDGGEFGEAIEHLRKAIEIHPKATGIHEKIGHALVESGRYEEANVELEAEIAVQPGSVTAHFLLGQAYSKQREYKKAQSHYEKALELNPDYAKACYGLAQVFVRLKEGEKAREYQAKFRELQAGESGSSDEDRASSVISDLASARANAAVAFMNAENLYRAVRAFDRCEILLKRAVELDPDNSECHERLGSLYNLTDRLGEALIQLERMSEIEPSNPYCYLNMGKISVRLKDYAKAEDAFRNAIEVGPKLSAGYREVARLYLTTGDKAFEARKLAEEAVSLEKSAENLFVLSWACETSGDRAAALKAIEEAVRLEPENSNYSRVYERIKSEN